LPRNTFGYTVVHQEIGAGVIAPVSIPWKIMSKTTWWDIETLQEMVADGSLFEGGNSWRMNFFSRAREHGTATSRYYVNARYGKLLCESVCEYKNGIFTVKVTPLRTEEGPNNNDKPWSRWNKFPTASMN